MKDGKTTRIEIRVTPREKELFKEYAEKHNLTMSEAVRMLCQEIFKEEK